MALECNIYCVNLRRSVDRRERMTRRFTQQRLLTRAYFIDGVDADCALIDYYAQGVPDAHETRVRRELGCTAGHLKALRAFLECTDASSARGAIICEDDVLLHNEFAVRCAAVLANAPADARIVSLANLKRTDETIQWAGRAPERQNLCRTESPIWGAQMYWVSREWALALLRRYDRPYAEHPDRDEYGGRFWTNEKFLHTADTYCAWPLLGLEEVVASDIRDRDDLLYHAEHLEGWGYENYSAAERRHLSALYRGAAVAATVTVTATVAEDEGTQPEAPLDATGRALRTLFTDIYERALWNNGDPDVPRSGPGSSVAATVPLRARLATLLEHLHITSVLDVGCGDLTWVSAMRAFSDGHVRYHGIDVVPSLVAAGRRLHGRWAHLTCADARTCTLPAADLVLCKELAIHLEDAQFLDVLRNVARSECKHVLVSTDYAARAPHATDFTAPYHWRRVDVRLPPFMLRAHPPAHEWTDCGGGMGYVLLSRAQLRAALETAPLYRPLTSRFDTTRVLEYTGPLIAERDLAPESADVSPARIPRLVHVMWIGDRPMPAYVLQHVNDWRRLLRVPAAAPLYGSEASKCAADGTWRVRLWRNEDLHEGEFPREVLARAAQARKPAQRVDLLRVFLLRKHGGFYMDADMRALQSLEPLLRRMPWASALACHFDPIDMDYVTNSMLAATPEHEWMRAMCEEVMRAPLNTRELDHDTGPGATGRALHADMDVLVLPRAFFYPVSWRDPSAWYDARLSYGSHMYAASWKQEDY